MDIHENARTTPHGRMLIVQRLQAGQTAAQVARELGIDPRTVRKWRDRFAAEGETGLQDRSSRPHRSPTRTSAAVAAGIERLRRERRSGPAIAQHLALPTSTVGVVLRRCGLGRLEALDPKPEIVRYERDTPGELIHIDIKKLGRINGIGHRITGDRSQQRRSRGVGWEFLHVAVDDASSAPAPTRHAPTARPSASSRPASGSGPMHGRSRVPPNAARPCRLGSATTTANGHTQHSTANHPSAGS
jgi:transposase-like protein